LEQLGVIKLSEKGELIDNDNVRLGGLINTVRRIITRRGNPMATITLEDFTGSADVLVFGEALDAATPLLKKEQVVIITARVSVQEDKEPKFIAQDVFTIEQAKIRFARGLFISLSPECMDDDTLNTLEDIFLAHSGDVPLYFRVAASDGKSYLVRSRRYRLKTSEAVVRQMQEMLGDDRIQVSL
ncbi:hypothetical protein KKB28_04215, partial [bacterium]|nr:hypothetical protein [bacterium]